MVNILFLVHECVYNVHKTRIIDQLSLKLGLARKIKNMHAHPFL